MALAAAGPQGRTAAQLETGDPTILRLVEIAKRTAVSAANLLITGESGTGKSLLARLVHDSSGRAEGPFVEIPCANLPEELIESELFGHERGAFTGAVVTRVGRFEQAQGGTVLIDGVAELSPLLQGKLLRVLQEKSLERLGGNRTLEIDTRIIASAGEDIDARVSSGVFRQDLFYRLNVVRLDLPPLRDRPGDIRRLAQRFLEELPGDTRPTRWSADALALLEGHAWPGNVRELKNAVASAALACQGAEIRPEDLPVMQGRGIAGLIAPAARSGFTLAQVEEAYVREVLRCTDGNKSEAARILGIHRKTLLEKRRRYGID